MVLDPSSARKGRLRAAIAEAAAAAPALIAEVVPGGSYRDAVIAVLSGPSSGFARAGRGAGLVIAACWDAGQTAPAPLVAAVGFECLLAGVDLLDEIEDGDPSQAMDTYGAAVATNVAAGLLVAGGELMRRACDELVRRGGPGTDGFGQTVTRRLLQAAAGQHLDLTKHGGRNLTSAPLEVVAAKAAALTRMACEVGAACGTNDRARIQELGEVGSLLGLAGQLRNDSRELLAKVDGVYAVDPLGEAVDGLAEWVLADTYHRRAQAAAVRARAAWLGDFMLRVPHASSGPPGIERPAHSAQSEVETAR